MAMARRDDYGKERFWRRVLRQWGRSDLTIRDFCAEQGLAEGSFYAWRQTIAKRDQAAATSHTQPAFVQVHVVPAPASAALELVLDQGLAVRVPAGFDVATLRQLLTVLKEMPSC
jgi:transposase